MKNGTPWIIALCVAGYLAVSVVSSEYAKIRSAIGETKQKTDAVADETKATIESIRQTIDELRSKFTLLETQMNSKPSEEKPADDVAETEPIKEVKKPTIEMYSATTCGPCQRWKREAMAVWQAQGWNVIVYETEVAQETVPRFEIFDGKKRFTVRGYLTKELYEQARQGATIE